MHLAKIGWAEVVQRGGRAVAGFGGALLVLASAGPAFADAIASDPPCPPNELYYPGGHQGRLCGAPRCNVDDDCAADQACMKYCTTPAGIFGVRPTTTTRCTSDDQCGTYRCAPMYCEVGRREVAGPSSDERPAAPAPSDAPAPDDTPPPASGGSSPSTTDQTGKRGVEEDDGGCRVATQPGRFGLAASGLSLVALLLLGSRRARPALRSVR